MSVEINPSHFVNNSSGVKMNGMLDEIPYYSGTNNRNITEYTGGAEVTFNLGNDVAYWYPSYSYLDFDIAFFGREKGTCRGQYGDLRPAGGKITSTDEKYIKPMVEIETDGKVKPYTRPIWDDNTAAGTVVKASVEDAVAYLEESYMTQSFDTTKLKAVRTNKDDQYHSLISPPSVDEMFSTVELKIGTLSIKRITNLPYKNLLARWVTMTENTNDENIGVLNPENLYGEGPYMNFPDTEEANIVKFRLRFMVHTLLNDFGVVNSSNTTAPISLIFTVAPPEQMFKPRITQSLIKNVFFRDDVYWLPHAAIKFSSGHATDAITLENVKLPAFLNYSEITTYCRIFTPKLLLRTMKIPVTSVMPKNIQSQVHKNVSELYLPGWSFNEEDIKISSNTSSVKGIFTTLRHVNAESKILPLNTNVFFGNYYLPTTVFNKTDSLSDTTWDFNAGVGGLTSAWSIKEIAQNVDNFVVMSHCLDFYPEIPIREIIVKMNGVIQDPNIPFDFRKSSLDRYEDYFGKTSLHPGTKPAAGNKFCNLKTSVGIDFQYETTVNSGIAAGIRGPESSYGKAPPYSEVGMSLNTSSQKGDSFRGNSLDLYNVSSAFSFSALTLKNEFSTITTKEQYAYKAGGKCFYYRRMMDTPGMPKSWGKYNFSQTNPMYKLIPPALNPDVKLWFQENYIPIFTMVGDTMAQYNNGAIITTD